jgi:hypothetical protein
MWQAFWHAVNEKLSKTVLVKLRLHHKNIVMVGLSQGHSKLIFHLYSLSVVVCVRFHVKTLWHAAKENLLTVLLRLSFWEEGKEKLF